MMTVQQQSEAFLKGLAGRKRYPIKPATMAAYRSYIRTWIVPQLGRLAVENVENDTLRELVSKMSDSGLSASTMTGVTNCVKQMVGSVTDKRGNELYPRKWNNEFIDLPVVDPLKQKNPVLSGSEVTGAILKSAGQYRLLFTILAASGLRISEALALKPVPSEKSSFWDGQRGILVIRKQLYHGKEQETKTGAGVREVDISSDLNRHIQEFGPVGEWLFTNEYGSRPMRLRTAYNVAQSVGVPGFHSLRRFRVTHLENVGVPRGLVQFWAGHAGKEVTDRYVKIGQDVAARKQWAEKAGLGFEL